MISYSLQYTDEGKVSIVITELRLNFLSLFTGAIVGKHFG